MSTKNTKQWTGSFGFILSVAGAAIGLGNIWKFPYMVGENGGSAFVIVYLFFVVILGLPLMLAEMVIGRCSKQNPVTSFDTLCQRFRLHPVFAKTGWLLVATALCILSFYSVIAGFSLAYLYDACLGVFSNMTVGDVHKHWSSFVSDPIQVLLWNTLFLSLSLAVIAKGVQKGIEQTNRILMPALYLILMLLVGYGYSLSGFHDAVTFMFGFRLEALSPSVVISAMGHAFFSLAIGAGCLISYGAYLPKQHAIGGRVFIVALMSILVAFMSGLAIFSIVFTYHLPPTGGPGLMFEILPIAFATMPYGQIVSLLFFLMLVLAAWTSAISFIEVLVSLLEERYHKTRQQAIVMVGLLTWCLGLGSVFSFNIWNQGLIGNRNFFLVITDISTNILLPLAGLCIAIFVGWILPASSTQKPLGFHSARAHHIWKLMLKWIVPTCIILVMLSTIRG